MIQAPDPFMFKMQLMAGLPANFISFVLDKGCSAETGSADDILHYACQVEEIGKMRKHFNEKKCIMDSTRLKTTSSTKHSKAKDPSPERSVEWSQDRSQKHNRKYRDYHRSSGSGYPDQSKRKHGDGDRRERDRHDPKHHSSGGKTHQQAGQKSDRSEEHTSELQSRP